VTGLVEDRVERFAKDEVGACRFTPTRSACWQVQRRRGWRPAGSPRRETRLGRSTRSASWSPLDEADAFGESPRRGSSKKVTGNKSVRRCVQGVRAAAARCGPLQTGATGLEPAASGVTERSLAPRIPCKHVGWGLERSLSVTFLRSAAGRCEPHAPQTRLLPASIEDAIGAILLGGSDRLMWHAVRVQDRCPRSAWRARRARLDAIRRSRACRRGVVVFVISCPPARRRCERFAVKALPVDTRLDRERERAASGRDPARRAPARCWLLGLLHEYSLRQASRWPATARDEPRGDSKRAHP
jgi:hypothetical protein